LEKQYFKGRKVLPGFFEQADLSALEIAQKSNYDLMKQGAFSADPVIGGFAIQINQISKAGHCQVV
jgi:hypothetical protein